MDGMLSQDEINALLQGMDLSDTADSGASPETPQDSSSAENTDNAYVKDVAPTVGDEEELTDVEKDAIGEVANISMGSSATTLYSLVNRKVILPLRWLHWPHGRLCWIVTRSPAYLFRSSIQRGWTAPIFWC